MKQLDVIQKIEVALLFLSVCLYGLFYDSFAGIMGILFIVLLALRLYSRQRTVKGKAAVGMYLQLPKNLLLMGLSALAFFALLSIPFAIDKGMALMGWVKFLPLTSFILLMAQEAKETRESLLNLIPIMAAVVTVVGLGAWFTPLKDYFFINDRFSGVFQYANGYALFLLIALIILLWSEENRTNDNCIKNGVKDSVKNSILAAILVIGIIATGCRAVFFLMALSIVVWAISCLKNRENRKNRENTKKILWPIGAIVVVVVASLLLAVATGRMREFARYTQFNIHSSSLMGRLLYNIDGVKMLLQHPLGLGYKGYSFYQGAVETGNYTVTFAHNELLQTALDFGIIIGLIIGVGYLMAVLKKGIPLRNRLILGVAAIHGLFDWSLQFLVTLMILTLVVEYDSTVNLSLHGAKRMVTGLIFAAAVVSSAWLGTASLLEFAGDYSGAATLYPGLTTSQMRRINSADSDTEKYQAAERICKQNQYCTIALQAMAEKSAREGNFDEMVSYGKQAVLSSRYNKQGYEIYIYMLSYAVESSNQQGDSEKTYRYLKAAAQVKDIIEEVETETSPLAEYLYDKPEIELDEEYSSYIEQAKSIV